jgi:putative sigma-54 modulation protein
MNIQLTGHHVDVTPALREHLVEKLERVKHHFDHAVEVKAIFSVEKNLQTASLRLRSNGQDFHADDSQENLYASIDLAVDKLDKQVIKHKKKLNDVSHDTVKRTIA